MTGASSRPTERKTLATASADHTVKLCHLTDLTLDKDISLSADSS
jgi:hypothetical protein